MLNQHDGAKRKIINKNISEKNCFTELRISLN
jgi:hypothetical protein